jgi:hypothetical protein
MRLQADIQDTSLRFGCTLSYPVTAMSVAQMRVAKPVVIVPPPACKHFPAALACALPCIIGKEQYA